MKMVILGSAMLNKNNVTRTGAPLYTVQSTTSQMVMILLLYSDLGMNTVSGNR